MPGAPLVRHVTKTNSGGFQELAGGQALPRLAREAGVHDIPGGPVNEVAAVLVARGARAADGPERELLTAFATGLATGLASMVAVLDPELVVLSGALISAGGEPLRALVQSELGELAASRPRLVIGEVTQLPVLRGALEAALATTRDEVFDTAR